MSHNDGHLEKLFLSILLHALLLPLAADSAPGLDHPDGGCDTVARIPLDAVVRNAGAQECYAVEAFSPGLLAIELSPTGHGGVETRLGDFAPLCGSPDVKHASFDTLERLANRQLLAVRTPGTYRFCVSAQDPEEPPESSKLIALFLAAWATKDGDPREEEPDPDLMVQDPIATAVYERFRGACGALAADDHGDTFLCATPLELGGEVKGEIWNVWGDDEDLFVFQLDELTTVRVEATADGAAFGGLYDRYGHRLHVRTRNDDAGWRLVTTLAPGPYSLRLTGKDGLGGGYRLSVETVDR